MLCALHDVAGRGSRVAGAAAGQVAGLLGFYCVGARRRSVRRLGRRIRPVQRSVCLKRDRLGLLPHTQSGCSLRLAAKERGRVIGLGGSHGRPQDDAGSGALRPLGWSYGAAARLSLARERRERQPQSACGRRRDSTAWPREPWTAVAPGHERVCACASFPPPTPA